MSKTNTNTISAQAHSMMGVLHDGNVSNTDNRSAPCRCNNRTTRHLMTMLFTIIGLFIMSSPSGCSSYYGDPFKDAFMDQAPITTASSQQLKTSETQASMRHRDHQTIYTATSDGTVSHGPLYFQNDWLYRANDDQCFAWTSKDYLGMPYGIARFLVNIVESPAKIVIDPPCTYVSSHSSVD